MFRRTLAALRISLSITFLAMAAPAAFAADPSLHEVYQAAEAGNYRAAQSMMDQVLKDHPNSAKAHFVEAELLAKQGQSGAANRELNVAEGLAPGLPFAKPGAVAELKAQLTHHELNNGGTTPVAATASPGTSFPWGWLLGGGTLLAAFLFFLNRSRQPVVLTAPAGGGAPWTGGAAPQSGWGAPPYGPMAPSGGIYPGGSSGMGSSILGGLATGAAVGAGMVAGEALMHRVLDGGHASPSFNNDAAFIPQSDSPSNYDMGGNDFGVSDASSWDDSSSGGDDWS